MTVLPLVFQITAAGEDDVDTRFLGTVAGLGSRVCGVVDQSKAGWDPLPWSVLFFRGPDPLAAAGKRLIT